MKSQGWQALGSTGLIVPGYAWVVASDDAIKKLARQVGEVDKRLENVEETVESHTKTLEDHTTSLDEILALVKQIQATQGALASSVGLAMTELAVSRQLEKRVERLEAAVFPPKH